MKYKLTSYCILLVCYCIFTLSLDGTKVDPKCKNNENSLKFEHFKQCDATIYHNVEVLLNDVDGLIWDIRKVIKMKEIYN